MEEELIFCKGEILDRQSLAVRDICVQKFDSVDLNIHDRIQENCWVDLGVVQKVGHIEILLRCFI